MQQNGSGMHLTDRKKQEVHTMRNIFLALASIVRFFTLDIQEMKESRTEGAAA